MANALETPLPAWVVIPARGGSVGIPRKNLRMLGGKPLIEHTIGTALEVLEATRVIVITDDEEIAHVAEQAGATVVLEDDPTPGQETLDTKIVRNLPVLKGMGARDTDVIVTVQPTSPLLRSSTLAEAIGRFAQAGVASVLSVADDRHLRWQLNDQGDPAPSFNARVNRQQLPEEFRETGGIIAARLADIDSNGTRVVAPVSILVLDDDESIDIDSYADLYAAAHLLSRKRIAIRVDASKQLGMGHVYRMLAFASELARHELIVYLDANEPLGVEFFGRHPYRTRQVNGHADFLERVADYRPDLLVLDVLDTDAADIAELRQAAPGVKIVTFEDRGTGAAAADLLVAEFIDSPSVVKTQKLSGIDYALLAPSFETNVGPLRSLASEVSNVLILFGGTDPSMLGERALNSLVRTGYQGRVTIVRGLGAAPIPFAEDELSFEVELLEDVKNMSVVMSRADLAFTSAGRTIVELLSRGVPAICMAQNAKELTHTHANAENGVLALGLGALVDDAELDHATATMLRDHQLRFEYAARARSAGARRKNRTTIAAILERVGFDDFPEI